MNEKDQSRMIVTLNLGELQHVVEAAVERALAANSKKPIIEKDWLKASEAAELFGLPRTWFEERGRSGDIERSKPGRYVLFSKRDIERYLEEHKQKSGNRLTQRNPKVYGGKCHDRSGTEKGKNSIEDVADTTRSGDWDAEKLCCSNGKGRATDHAHNRVVHKIFAPDHE